MPNSIDLYVDFIENHLPGVKSGDYLLEIVQSLNGAGSINEAPENNEAPKNAAAFSIAGERFNLKPADIACVFPPAAGSGEYSNVLPHIVFDRNTLPWERMIAYPELQDDIDKIEKLPWMALLLFNEGELQSAGENAGAGNTEQGILMSLQDVRSKLKIHESNPEKADQQDDQLAIIYAKKSLLEKLILPASQLGSLCHARKSSLRMNLGTGNTMPAQIYYEIKNDKTELVQAAHLTPNTSGTQVELQPGDLSPGNYTITVYDGEDAVAEKLLVSTGLTITLNDELGHDVGIAVTNRLPKRGAKSIVHLVSLEGRYKKSADGQDFDFDFQTFQADDAVPLVSLKSWSFFCDDDPSFKGILKNLTPGDVDAQERQLRLPLLAAGAENDTVNIYLANGYGILSHFFRRGGKNMSWYRGPLAPGKTNNGLADLLPARCADELLTYNEEFGMLDISYAAAWELGRLLSLQNKPFSTGLYKWKRLHRRQLMESENRMLHPHLPNLTANAGLDLPDAVDSYFSELTLLKGIPFNYLVPYEKMLPVESIRFFSVDLDWISCLADGAFSVGRVTQNNQQHDVELVNNHFAKLPGSISGFLLRSKVVSGWPTLQVNGYTVPGPGQQPEEAPALTLLRMDRLSPEVLICLFDGDLASVAIHQKPEMIHFGFDSQPGVEEAYSKNGKPVEIDQDRIVNIKTLFETVKGSESVFTAAQFAVSLIEGVEKVLFVRAG